jgi:hypothetical protein
LGHAKPYIGKTTSLTFIRPGDKGDHHPRTLGPACDMKGQIMPRDMISLTIDNLSVFTKTLRNTLKQHDILPGHATMLGLVAKAAGYDNFRHLKADGPPSSTYVPTKKKRMERAMRVFENGIMTRWPKQTSVQGLCMWVFWAALTAREDMTEKQVNALLNARHSFKDHALLRRSLVDHKMVTLALDGSNYRRIEQAPPEDAAFLIAAQRPS